MARVSGVTAAVLALVVARSAQAACVITHAGPTTVLPTMRLGQTFSFVATDDCATVGFSVGGGTLRKEPMPGAMVGLHQRRYGVALTPAEWESVTGSMLTTFRWIATGRTTDGAFTRVMTTNELDSDRDGWTRSEGDAGECDFAADQNPGAPEIVGNGIDDDCDGQIDARLIDPDATVTTTRGSSYVGWAVAAGDVDADGIADLVLGNPWMFAQRGGVHLLSGPVEGPVHVSQATRLTFPARAPLAEAQFGFQVDVGDANGDGAEDVLVGALFADAAYLFLGPVTGDGGARDADFALRGQDESLLGDDVDIAGDFDGDSIADLVIGAPGPDPYGAVYVASGTSSGTVAASSATHVFSFDLSLSNYVGMHDADLGDATGDGITDLAMATPREVPDPKVYLIEGGLPPGTYDVESAAWATVETTADNQETGPALAGGDYDGDGTVDLFAGRELGRGYVYAFLGPLSGELTAGDAATTWETTEPFADGLGTAIAVDHIDGDDQLDVLMGHDRSDGVAFVQLGWVEGVIDVTTLPGFAPPRGGYRNSLATIPDWSGDGGAEILIGTPFAGDDLEGAARVYLSDRL